MPRYWRTSTLIFLNICFFSPLLGHAVLSNYVRLMADDYCSSATAQLKGLLPATFFSYTTWTGRYSANFLDSLAGILGPYTNSIAAPFAIILWLIALAITIYQFRIASTRLKSLLISLCLASIILYTTFEISPQIIQSLYWGQGMRALVPPLILFTIYIGLVRYLHRQPSYHKTGIKWLFISGILTLVAGGFHESYASMQTIALAIGMIYARLIGSQKPKIYSLFLLSGFLGSIISMLIIALAPGNKFRQAYFPPTPGLIKLSGITILSVIKFAGRIGLNSRDISSLLGLLFISTLIGARIIWDATPMKESKPSVIKRLQAIPLITLILITVCFIPGAYGMSQSIPGRARIIPAYILAAGLATWGYFFGELIFLTDFDIDKKILTLSQKALIAILTGMFALVSVYAAFNLFQQQPTYRNYAMTWDKTYQQILEAKSQGNTTITIQPFYNLLGSPDIGTAPRDNWFTQCTNDYFGIEVIAQLPP